MAAAPAAEPCASALDAAALSKLSERVLCADTALGFFGAAALGFLGALGADDLTLGAVAVLARRVVVVFLEMTFAALGFAAARFLVAPPPPLFGMCVAPPNYQDCR